MALPEGFLPLTNIPDALRESLNKATERLDEVLAQADSLVDKLAERQQAERQQAERQQAERQQAERPSAAWLALSQTRREQLARVLAVSKFAGETLTRYPGWLASLDAEGELDAPLDAAMLSQMLANALDEASDEAHMQAVLRRFRRARMLGIIWRDLNRARGYGMWDTAASVSRLAEVCLEGALGWLEAHFAPRWGVPALREDGSEQRLVVLGMGKLGAGELNLSSDIDLIFAFPEKGTTRDGKREYDHQEYFTRLGQKLIAALDAITAEGFAFRVDMRLRPLGEGGPLTGSFNMMTSYYQDQGREWERYAMLKARPVAGDLAAGAELLTRLRPFVYRRYLDFGAIESLREMKALINREVRRKDSLDNIKLGPGGIREVEFVVQVFQLIRGGRDTELQVSSLNTALQRLPELELLPQAVVDELGSDYVFLRDLEHALQAQGDRQTQTLPENFLDRERLALAMSHAEQAYDDWSALAAQLKEVREHIRRHFDAVIADPEEDAEVPVDADDSAGDDEIPLEEWRAAWRGELTQEEGLKLFEGAGFIAPQESVRRLRTLRQSRAVQGMQRIGQERLETLMPLLLAALSENDAPDTALERTLPLVEAVLRRTAYLALLRENPDALHHLVTLCAASPWIAEQLARHPVLLDELLTPATLYSPADKARLTDDLRQALGRVPEEDEEAQIEALRIFKHAQVLHVAASDIAGARTLMKVSDYLTFIAEVVLEQVLAMAWRHLTRKHGLPQHRDGSRHREPNFLIAGYGKLGGIELGYGSDLDLVFIHDAAPQGSTDGTRAIDNAVFFTRLGQRIIHLLTAITPAGALYDVDMRLRPSGNSGLLVTSLESFADYQRNHAWTWEHQALVRARVVAGSADLAERFKAIRREVLGRERDPEALRQEVANMRHKMREHLGSSAKQREHGKFDLKHDAGGMIDIEFLSQYAVLLNGFQNLDLLAWSDNIRILETLESSGCMPDEDARQLREAYLAYRHIAHRNALTKSGTRVEAADYQVYRQVVETRWQRWLEPDTA